jgi:hypothetical protein
MWRSLIDKYGLDLFAMIHAYISAKHPSPLGWADLYSPAELKMRTHLVYVIKTNLIKAKREELAVKGVKGEELLTQASIEGWIAEGETYSSIAYNHTGTTAEVVTAAAKKYGIKSKGLEAFKDRVLPTDAELTTLLVAKPLADVFQEIHIVLCNGSCGVGEAVVDKPITAAKKPVTYDNLKQLLDEGKKLAEMSIVFGVEEKDIESMCKYYGLMKPKKNKYRGYKA